MKRNIIVKKIGKKIDIYYPCKHSENYLHYEFLRVDNDSINMHQWRTYYLSVANKNLERLYTFDEIEWEGAIREVDAKDFLGGYHGDENNTGISIFANAKLYPVDEDFEFETDCLRISVTSILNRCDTPGDDVFNRIKILEWSDKGYCISNRYELLQDFKIHRFENMMMGFGLFYNGERFITHAATNTHPIPQYISDDADEALKSPLFHPDHDATWFEFYAPEKNFYAKVEGFFDKDKYPNGYRRFDDYRIIHHKVTKAYFNMTGRYDGKKGEVFESKAIYTIEA